jgi:hypothetical protein
VKDFNQFLDLLNEEETKTKFKKIELGTLGEFTDENGRIKRDEMFSAFLAASQESTIFMLELYYEWSSAQ